GQGDRSQGKGEGNSLPLVLVLLLRLGEVQRLRRHLLAVEGVHLLLQVPPLLLHLPLLLLVQPLQLLKLVVAQELLPLGLVRLLEAAGTTGGGVSGVLSGPHRLVAHLDLIHAAHHSERQMGLCQKVQE
ncbi:hypothetical protein CRUP_000336, partial [Coryphaenoides rupestris]